MSRAGNPNGNPGAFFWPKLDIDGNQYRDGETDWMNDGACHGRGYPTDWWFASANGEYMDVLEAQLPGIAICKTQCPVIEECLAYALRWKIDYGAWGGLTTKERRAIRRRASEPTA